MRRGRTTPVDALRASPDDPTPAPFDPESLAGLPDPAQRLLARSLPAGTPIDVVVELDAVGSIRLGSSWWTFRSTQVLRAGQGFVWQARARRGPIVVRGADRYVDGTGSMDFRLFGLLAVARASGADVDRSAAGRLAAETVVWLPQAITPQAGAAWTAVDRDRACVTLPTPSGPVDVEVVVDDTGRLLSTRTMRWRDSPPPPVSRPFGGPITAELTTGTGVRIAAAGAVGWGWETAEWPDGEFFRFRVEAVR